MNPANLLIILEVIDRLLGSAGRYAAMARQAAAEGRDISPEEIKAMQVLDDAAKDSLDAAIAAREAADAGGGGV